MLSCTLRRQEGSAAVAEKMPRDGSDGSARPSLDRHELDLSARHERSNKCPMVPAEQNMHGRVSQTRNVRVGSKAGRAESTRAGTSAALAPAQRAGKLGPQWRRSALALEQPDELLRRVVGCHRAAQGRAGAAPRLGSAL